MKEDNNKSAGVWVKHLGQQVTFGFEGSKKKGIVEGYHPLWGVVIFDPANAVIPHHYVREELIDWPAIKEGDVVYVPIEIREGGELPSKEGPVRTVSKDVASLGLWYKNIDSFRGENGEFIYSHWLKPITIPPSSISKEEDYVPGASGSDEASVAALRSGFSNSIEQAVNIKEVVLSEYKKGNIVVATFEGLQTMPLKEFIKQHSDGMLYDLNRSEEVVLTFINDPKWVNDYAVAAVIRELKRQIDELPNKP